VKRSTTVDAAKAAAFVLGALPSHAAAELEERIAASPALREEVAALRAVADELLLAADPVEPRAAVRARLLSRVAAEATPAATAPAVAAPSPHTPRPLPDMLFALQPDAVWKEVGPGLQRRMLSRGPDATSYVLRVAPGATIPPHDHGCVEHLFVVSGSIDVDGTLCHPGDYHRAAQGTRHQATYSAEGCLVLVVESAA
jgi:putative transcriptional regulator